MTRDETIALWEKCQLAREAAIADGKSQVDAHQAAKTIWNAWASPLIAERLAIENKGLLHSKNLFYEDFIVDWKKYEHQEAKNFYNLARCHFSEYVFSDNANFSGFLFPGDAWFGRVRQGVLGREWMPAIFETNTFFTRAVFYGDARFDRVVFNGHAGFEAAHFLSDAGFGQVQFNDVARFHSARFCKGVWLGQTNFHSYSNFINTIFDNIVSFEGMSADRAFILRGARFEKLIPDFSQATFREAPNFEQVNFPAPRFWRAHHYSDIARYRAMRRLAIQGHDHDAESKAFKGEIRAKRFKEHKPWHLAFWFGIFFDIFSDFGRSISRPIMFWLICTVMAAVFYLSQTDTMRSRSDPKTSTFVGQIINVAAGAIKNNVPCATPVPPQDTTKTYISGLGEIVASKTNARAEALHLAFRNAFIVLDSGTDAAHRTYGCLYGVEMYAGSNPVAYVPSEVSTVTAIQKLISVALIFLFLLSVRNQFKIK